MDTSKRLVRSRKDKMIGGVCGGLGEYFGIDPTLIRIAFAMLVIFGAGSPLLLYVLLWVIIPAADNPRVLLGVDADAAASVATVEPVAPAQPAQTSDTAPAVEEQEPTPAA